MTTLRWLLVLPLLISVSHSCRTTKEVANLKDESPRNERGTMTLVGLVPNVYYGKEDPNSTLSKVEIVNGVITSFSPVADVSTIAQTPTTKVLILKEDSTAEKYSVIYPGLINLHNHTKQNMLPLWSQANGQFDNRFEWREWQSYKDAVSGNMNPWSSISFAACAAFRWSELQAMVLGTVYLQGPSSCVGRFSIHQVEDKNSYLTSDPSATPERVSAPTDLFVPREIGFFWNEIRPLMSLKSLTYENALTEKISEFCGEGYLRSKSITDVNSSHASSVFMQRDVLEIECTSVADPSRTKTFTRFLSWQHPSLASKKRYLANPRYSGLIIHLSEGRADDQYNTKEFEILNLLGFGQPRLNLVHAVGVSEEQMKHMGSKGMGIIWSPFSNLLLYNQTIDIALARKHQVPLALGSDWTPTGSKSVLEEAKIARRHLVKEGFHLSLKSANPSQSRATYSFATDLNKIIFDMMTATPAKMINAYESDPNDRKHGIGTISVDAAASLIVVSNNKRNVFQNLIDASEKDIRLLIRDGTPIYGQESLVSQFHGSSIELANLPTDYDLSANDFEKFGPVSDKISEKLGPQIFTDEESEVDPANTGTPSTAPPRLTSSEALRTKLSPEDFDGLKMAMSDTTFEVSKKLGLCGFERKFLVTKSNDPLVEALKEKSGIDLDRPDDILRLISSFLMTSSYNHSPRKARGDKHFRVEKSPVMFSCNDPAYKSRFEAFVEKEVEQNQKNRIIESQNPLSDFRKKRNRSTIDRLNANFK